MKLKQGEQSDWSHAIEQLAQELEMPIDYVAVIYGAELERLKANAKFMAYVYIFAFRNTRKVLRQRGVMKSSGMETHSANQK